MSYRGIRNESGLGQRSLCIRNKIISHDRAEYDGHAETTRTVQEPIRGGVGKRHEIRCTVDGKRREQLTNMSVLEF